MNEEKEERRKRYLHNDVEGKEREKRKKVWRGKGECGESGFSVVRCLSFLLLPSASSSSFFVCFHEGVTWSGKPGWE